MADLDIIATVTAGTLIANTETQLSVPSAKQNGDYLVAIFRDQSNVATSDLFNASFSRWGVPFLASNAQARIMGVYVHRITDVASEPATYTFSRPGAATRRAGTMLLVRPANPNGTMIVSGFAPEYSGIAGTDRGVSGYNGTGLTLLYAGAEVNAGIASSLASIPAGYSQVAFPFSAGDTTVTRTGLWVGQKESTGSVAATAVDFSGAPTAVGAQSITLGYVPPAAEPSYSVELGSGEQANVSLWTGTEELPISGILALPRTGYTISEMESDIANGRDVFWAHRGSSLDWSEMTMRAFTNAVWHGCRALEVSVRRSSDGVWIASHDADLSRVTGTALGPITANHSSAMLGLPVIAPKVGGVICRIEEILAAWPHMLWVIDNKSGESASELFAIIKAMIPNWQDRVIIKIDGAHNYTLFQTAQSAGFKTAAYFFATTTDAKITENMPYVDYPGMDWGAAQARWDFVAAFGKPLWGHVLPSLSAKTTAEAKGAVIFQCASLKEIMPPVNIIP